ncbi:MAG: hypothetical protein RBT60_06700 [Candidatus Krumholzibacteria bacterium]|nr:hypothetical protein [Candidatus Krumholzibacteria bacterium]
MRSAVLAILSLTVAAALAADLPDHPARLAPLTPASTFPRFTAEQLQAAGYPDHKHVHTYPDFTPFVDAEGQPYGPQSLLRRFTSLPREVLVVDEGEIRYRNIHMAFPAELQVANMIAMIEALDWAHHELTALMAHDCDDTLRVVSAFDLYDYRRRTGQAFHRLYRSLGDVVVIQPAQILLARGLSVHAAFHLTARRLIADLARGAELPAWLGEGLASYLAEDGPHFHAQLAMYRASRPIVLAPAETEAILAAPVHEDDETDKVRYRTAGYSAFLMAWELVENRGGLGKVRELLARSGAGEQPDVVCRDLYGSDLAQLTAALNPTLRPEPVGADVPVKIPQQPPTP